MAEARFDELKRYVRFGAEDARTLLAFRSVAEPHFSRIAREFYERISRFTLPIGHESAALAGDSP